jgi:hypothetical protein
MISVLAVVPDEPTEATSSMLRRVPLRKRVRNKAGAAELTRERILGAAYHFSGNSLA